MRAIGSMCSKLCRAEGSTISRSQLILSKHSVASFCFSANAIKIEANAFLSCSPLFSKIANLPVQCLEYVNANAFCSKLMLATPPLTCTGLYPSLYWQRDPLWWTRNQTAYCCFLLAFLCSGLGKASCHESCDLGGLNATNQNRDRIRTMLCQQVFLVKISSSNTFKVVLKPYIEDSIKLRAERCSTEPMH